MTSMYTSLTGRVEILQNVIDSTNYFHETLSIRAPILNFTKKIIIKTTELEKSEAPINFWIDCLQSSHGIQTPKFL